MKEEFLLEKPMAIVPNLVPRAKHYDEMNRKERREYERALKKAGMWDAAVVFKNMKQSGQLIEG